MDDYISRQSSILLLTGLDVEQLHHRYAKPPSISLDLVELPNLANCPTLGGGKYLISGVQHKQATNLKLIEDVHYG